MSDQNERLDFEITHRPDFALLTVQLMDGQHVFAEPAAMASMDTTVTLRSGLRGGIARTIGRAFAGENIVVNRFSAEGGNGEVSFAPGPAGDMSHYYLTGNRLYLQRGAFVAHGPGVEISGSWQGARGFFSGEGLVLLQATGNGDIFFNSYGAILEIDVSGNYIVDTGYIVAFEDTLDYTVSVLPGLGVGAKIKSLLFGGEGLVCRFSGHGKIWIQTRTVNPFLTWLHPYRPQGSR